MGFGEGPAAEFCCYRVTEYRADEGRSGLLYDPLATEGEGPYPKGARPPRVPAVGGKSRTG